MRRIPFVLVKNKRIYYVCPKCKNIIPRDLYKICDECTSCMHPLNKDAKSLLKFYKIYDKELYELFIYNSRRNKL